MVPKYNGKGIKGGKVLEPKVGIYEDFAMTTTTTTTTTTSQQPESLPTGGANNTGADMNMNNLDIEWFVTQGDLIEGFDQKLQGDILHMMTRFLERRKVARAKYADLNDRRIEEHMIGNPKVKTMKVMYIAQQLAYKVCANEIYGQLFNRARGWNRIAFPYVGAAITAKGRNLVDTIVQLTKDSEYDFEVISAIRIRSLYFVPNPGSIEL
ncbi:hypothetical protein SARC_06924 [Sphaeroforma arctica JP610]|uniref:DNA-directed DNA polymerase n=1 Tax=Sphaeroforma arctica JP610 TaxID=667725 RepID=A0A0L0FV67_9EUKA|nr:hypothetical protein SARC_06924 [Sphaeroforma arctica JP610]KNC80722.1 hypothetical protein SARC_06924 [Sphaeroforma arctica JP610]|eukprot:XP_014154624.1 hypothetical protein SARC_06924 [Sphaeroforma arctica JP610]